MNIPGINNALNAAANLPAGSAKKRTAESAVSGSFAQSLAEAEKADSFVLSSAGETQSEDMSMDEYKLYIYQKIMKMPKCNSRRRDNAVFITDEGYAAMKNDPAYEKWALEKIRASFRDGGCSFGGKERVHSVQIIGASEDDCRYERWSSGGDVLEPSKEELKRVRLKRKAKAEKHIRYVRVMRENSIKRYEKEMDHIRGIYEDYLHEQKNVCAAMSNSKFMLWLG